MEIKDFQNQINEIVEKIDEKTGVKHNLNNTFFHLIEEIGELADELNKPNIRNKEIDKQNLKEEFADVLVLITRLACINDIDIEDAIKNKIEIFKQRHNLDI